VNAEPRLLLLETSGRGGFTAVAEGNALLAARLLDNTRQHARDLAPAIAELLAEVGWKPADVLGVAVGLGPGSYTGLRVGLMTAKAFCYAVGATLLGIPTFFTLARQTPDSAAQIDILADAQQGKVYRQPFRRVGECWSPTAALSICPLEQWLAERSPQAWVGGPGVIAFRDRLADVPVASGTELPRPDSLLSLALARWQAGERDDLWTLEPIYLRPSAAESQWQQRRG